MNVIRIALLGAFAGAMATDPCSSAIFPWMHTDYPEIRIENVTLPLSTAEAEMFYFNFYRVFFDVRQDGFAPNAAQEFWKPPDAAARWQRPSIAVRVLLHNNVVGFFMLQFPKNGCALTKRFALDPNRNWDEQKLIIEALSMCLFSQLDIHVWTIIVPKFCACAQQRLQHLGLTSAPLKDDPVMFGDVNYPTDWIAFEIKRPDSLESIGALN